MRSILDDKRGQGGGTTIPTLIAIILGVLVLVVLAIGFTMGWGDLYGKMQSFFGGGPNVDEKVTACRTNCMAGQGGAFYSWCNQKMQVTAGEKLFHTKSGSKDFNETAASGNEDPDSEKVANITCSQLNEYYNELGFEPCPEADC